MDSSSIWILFWGEFHPILVHFPVVLIPLVFICDLIAWFGKRQYLEFGTFCLVAAVITAIPTIVTGLIASTQFSTEFVYWHQWVAITTSLLTTFYAAARLYRLKVGYSLPISRYLLIDSLCLILTVITGELGGELSQGMTPFKIVLEEFQVSEM